ncbi:hypothetical protein BHM03_00009288 [Ensete ventricosum]|uniref:RING-type E3 ubiquitin transferase n=1 Tax=Ensete ventricosum TaxID=4639 RepID=A0A445MCN1_ENSVE|nr:hypothetical protein BHM03_00009288 [Ensete ventricosum]
MKGSEEHGWASKGSGREIAEEEEEEEEVYVAVVKDVKEGKANLLWLLHNTPEDKKVVVVHVHRPAQRIPTGVDACCVDEAVAAHKPTSTSADRSPHTELAMAAWSDEGPAGSSTSGSGESSVNDTWDAASRASDHSLHVNMASSPTVPPEADTDDDGSLVLRTLTAPGDVPHFHSPQRRSMEDLGAMYQRLQSKLNEADNTKREAYEELHKRQIAEKDLSEASRKVRYLCSVNQRQTAFMLISHGTTAQVDVAETAYNKEVRRRKEIEEAVAKDKMQLSALRKERDEVHEELQQARQKMAALKLQASDSTQILKDIKANLSEAYSHLDSIRVDHELPQQERLDQKKEAATTSTRGAAQHLSEFSLSELEQATENFHEASKIGEGGYGCVYRGSLRHTTVAIKRLNPQGLQGTAEFQREVTPDLHIASANSSMPVNI